MNQEVEYYTLKNIKLHITFLSDSLFTYHDTIEKLLNADTEIMMWHLKHGTFYSIEVDEKNGSFAKITLFYNGKKINFQNDISIVTFIDNCKISVITPLGEYLEFNEEMIKTPPCELSHLALEVIGDLRYFEVDDHQSLDKYLISEYDDTFMNNHHPIDENYNIENILIQYNEQIVKEKNSTKISEIDSLEDKQKVKFIGMIQEIKLKISKKVNKFGILTLKDLTGEIDFILFENELEHVQNNLDVNKPIIITAKLRYYDNNTKSFRVLKIKNLI